MTSEGKVLLVEDDPSLRGALCAAFEHHGFEVDAHAETGTALHAMTGGPWDVLVTDLGLPGGSGLTLLRRAAEVLPDTTAIVITGKPTVDSAVEALRLAAVDYLVKPFQPQHLVDRARHAVVKTRAARRARLSSHEGEAPRTLEPGRSTSAGEPAPQWFQGLSPLERSALSERELEVIERMAKGMAPKEIATALGISVHTARNHLRSIYAKLDVHSQLELMRKILG